MCKKVIKNQSINNKRETISDNQKLTADYNYNPLQQQKQHWLIVLV